MSAGAATVRSAPRSRASAVALLAVAGATALSVPLWGHPGASIAPVLIAALLWAMWRLPLHVSAGALAFVLLAVDDSRTANGLWHTPLAFVGDLLRQSLRTFTPAASGLAITGTEIVLVLLLGVSAWRRAHREAVPGQVLSPPALRAVMLVYLAAIVYAIVNGLARGGSADAVVWQTRSLFVTAALFFVFDAAFRGPVDHVLIGKIVVIAAALRAVLAVWVRYVVPQGSELPHVTDHGDSMLFSLACMVLVAHLLERPDRKRLETALVFLPLLVLGIHANARRTAWLQLALATIVFFVVGRGARWKRSLVWLGVVLAPIVVLYGAAGWNSSSPAYAPVQVVRSVVDARVDRSAWDRQVENWNLAMSMRERPLSGRGFGHEWTEYFQGDEITSIFVRYKTEPHNQVLGLLLFAGGLAFAGIWAPLAVLVLLGARAYARVRTPESRAAALAVAATAVIVAVQCFSDLGPFWPQYWVLTALALATGGKLARASGALR